MRRPLHPIREDPCEEDAVLSANVYTTPGCKAGLHPGSGPLPSLFALSMLNPEAFPPILKPFSPHLGSVTWWYPLERSN